MCEIFQDLRIITLKIHELEDNFNSLTLWLSNNNTNLKSKYHDKTTSYFYSERDSRIVLSLKIAYKKERTDCHHKCRNRRSKMKLIIAVFLFISYGFIVQIADTAPADGNFTYFSNVMELFINFE